MTRKLIQTFMTTTPKEWQESCLCLPNDDTWLLGICDDNGNGHKLLSIPLDGENRELTGAPKRKHFAQVTGIRAGGALSYKLKALQGDELVAVFDKSVHIMDDNLKSQHKLKHSRQIKDIFSTPAGTLLTIVDDGSIVLQHWDPATGQKAHKESAPKLYTGKMKGDDWYWRQFVKAAAMDQHGRLALSTLHYQFEQTGNRSPEFINTLRLFDPDGTELWRTTLDKQSDALILDPQGRVWVFSSGLQIQCFSNEGEELHQTILEAEELRGGSWRSVHLRGDRLFLGVAFIGGGNHCVLDTTLEAPGTFTSYNGYLAALSPSGETMVMQESLDDDLLSMHAYKVTHT